jgi:uncharacterized Zn finger protein
MSYYGYYGFRPYVSVAERRRKAERQMQKLKKTGHPVSPVVIERRTIAGTFWGKAWCDNLERYSDFSNRLPRGRTYVRNGSVVDLQIAPGEVVAMVSGSDLYRVSVKVSAVPKARWTSICADCAGAIDSLIELLQGRFSKGVMERICQQQAGLFPAPAELEFSCSCPDWASMCKHVAAVFYGIGARLDEKPELLFKLRNVNETDLIAKAGRGLPLSRKESAGNKVLVADNLSELFGLEVGVSTDEPKAAAALERKRTTRVRHAANPRAAKAGAAPAKVAAPKVGRRRPSSTHKRKLSQAKTKSNTRTSKAARR